MGKKKVISCLKSYYMYLQMYLLNHLQEFLIVSCFKLHYIHLADDYVQSDL